MLPDADAVLATFKPSTSVFYLDVSENVLVPKLIKYIQFNGGQCSPFLDKNVTHLVTDKAKTMAEVYPIAQKWSIAVWSVEQFATVILHYMDRKGTRVTSPTLHRVISRKRDLSQFLEEEKRHQSKPAKSAAPQFPLTRAAPGANAPSAGPPENSIVFAPFEAHYVMIEDAEGLHCPIFKEYPVQPLQSATDQAFKVPRMAYPMFYWESPVGQCAFIPPLAAAAQPPQPAQSQPRAASEKKENARGANENGLRAAKTGGTELVAGTAELRARLLRNSRLKAAKPELAAHDIHRFEPVMTDSTVMTAKSVLARGGPAKPPPAGGGGIKISPCISVSINRAAASTPKHHHHHHHQHHPVLAVKTLAAGRHKSSSAAGDASQSRKRPASRAAAASQTHNRPRPGFCECCYEKYSDLDKHVKTAYHRTFAVQSGNYEGIDVFLASLRRTFTPEFLKNVNKTNLPGIADAPAVLLPQQSPVSPSTTMSAHAPAARNYMGAKRARQSALEPLRIRSLTAKDPSLAEEDDPAASNQLSSPSCKRRKLQRAR